ncbi:MAG: hypothetical protein MUC68_12660 [Burkholderiaceae bacterium]|nr:hypothetical protein [Burkholderiaceae bacterium]
MFAALGALAAVAAAQAPTVANDTRARYLRCAAVFAAASKEAPEQRARDGYGNAVLLLTTWASELDAGTTLQTSVDRVGRDLVAAIDRLAAERRAAPADPLADELARCRTLFNEASRARPQRP